MILVKRRPKPTISGHPNQQDKLLIVDLHEEVCYHCKFLGLKQNHIFRHQLRILLGNRGNWQPEGRESQFSRRKIHKSNISRYFMVRLRESRTPGIYTLPLVL